MIKWIDIMIAASLTERLAYRFDQMPSTPLIGIVLESF
jgi:hypothetical protein